MSTVFEREFEHEDTEYWQPYEMTYHLNTVIKQEFDHADTRHIQLCIGLVINFDDTWNLYTVMYADGYEEEMDEVLVCHRLG